MWNTWYTVQDEKLSGAFPGSVSSGNLRFLGALGIDRPCGCKGRLWESGDVRFRVNLRRFA